MELKKIDRVYTEEQWKIDFLFNILRVSLPCPRCKLIGYMGYTQPAVPEYCMCKLCGFWQAVGEKPRPCNLFYHNCKGNKQPLPPTGHPRKGHCWIAADKVECEYCDEIIANKVQWPAELDNPNDHLLLKP